MNDAKILFRLFKVDRLNSILKNTSKVINIIENAKTQEGDDYAINSKKGLVQLILVIVDNWFIKSLKDILHQPYKDLYERLDFLSRQQTNENKNKEYHDITDYVARIKDKFGENSKQFIIAKLYEESTRRDDFKLKIISNDKEATDTNENYLVVPKTRTVCQTVINAHKTSGHFEPLVKNLSPYLSEIIRNYMAENNLSYGDYLFALSTFSRFVSKMSKDIGLEGITINTLRHMAITKFMSVPRSLEEKQALAKEFGHSMRTQAEYQGNLASPVETEKSKKKGKK